MRGGEGRGEEMGERWEGRGREGWEGWEEEGEVGRGEDIRDWREGRFQV